MKKHIDWKIIVGFVISLLFLYLAFRQVDLKQMGNAFGKANYWYLLPVLVVLLFSHLIRAIRWGYLIAPIGKVGIGNLYSALIIGYMANTFVPAHLGEIFRAYVVGRKNNIPSSAVFGTVVMERILDVFSLLILMGLTLIVYPFPDWVKKSGYISFAVIMVLFLGLILLKIFHGPGLALLQKVLGILPENLANSLFHLVKSFLDGIVPLKKWHHYLMVLVLTVIMWTCYAFMFHLSFYAFDFVNRYDLPWMAALVMLVVTTISIAVPSSPGYVGTYHYLCQQGLDWFGIPQSEALSFAIVAHAINFIPVLLLGFVFLYFEGLSFKNLRKKPGGVVPESD